MQKLVLVAVAAIVLIAAVDAASNPKPKLAALKKGLNPAQQREVCTVKGQVGSGVCLIQGNCNKHIAKNKSIKYVSAAAGASACPKNQACCFTPAVAPAPAKPQAATVPAAAKPPTATAPAVPSAPAPAKPAAKPSSCDANRLCYMCVKQLTPGDKCVYNKKTGKCQSDKIAIPAGTRADYAKPFWGGALYDAREYPMDYECKNAPLNGY